jgi:hypothetical protein
MIANECKTKETVALACLLSLWCLGVDLGGLGVVRLEATLSSAMAASHNALNAGQSFWVWYIVWDGGADSLDGIRLAPPPIVFARVECTER